MRLIVVFAIANLSFGSIIPHFKKKPPPPAAVDQYVKDADSRPRDPSAGTTAGSTWSLSSSMSDLASDVLAIHVDDVLTVVVSEATSEVATGATKTSRVSTTANSINALAGVTSATGSLANLAKTSGDTELNGSGSVTRTLNLTTTLTARVTHVLPNGFLVVEGTKYVQINSEWQTITLRGVVRPADLASNNSVPSGSIAELEIKVDGKGVITDAVRRPAFLYRLLLGLLPF